jgi:outer membrane protein OmpA-like peptidoglycan-associated protein
VNSTASEVKRRTLQNTAALAATTAALALLVPVHAGAQQPPLPALDTVGTRAGAIGVHALVGAFVGRLDFAGGAVTHLLGGRLGVGLGELVQLSGWYWREFDRQDRGFGAESALGGEVQLNLNTGFGIAPFVTGGIAQVGLDELAAQTAAVAGAGLQLPLGPLIMQAGVRNYMFGVTGLRGEDSPEDVTHNWKFSAGLLMSPGRGRAQRPVLMARSPAEFELAALRDSLARAAALPAPPDTLLRDGTRQAVVLADTAARNYHSDQRIEIPLPTWGSITLRYGPEPEPQPPAPIIVQAPAAPATTGAPAAAADASPPATPPQAPLPQPPALAQPQFVLPQQAPQFILPQAGQPPITQAQLDGIAQRVLDGMRLSLLPQLEAAQAQRLNALRDDLRRELARLEGTLATAPAPAGAPPPAAAAPGAPAAAPGAVLPPTAALRDAAAAARTVTGAPAPPATDPLLLQVEREVAAAEAALDEARAEARLRQAVADVASRQPVFLEAAETVRGPGLVLRDAAFTPDGLRPGDASRGALDAVAELLQAHPDRTVFVQAHVDGGRSELESQRLSELRAEAVRSMLVRAGVAPDRVLAVGYGHGRPAARGDTEAGRAQNRRVEIVLGRE